MKTLHFFIPAPKVLGWESSPCMQFDVFRKVFLWHLQKYLSASKNVFVRLKHVKIWTLCISWSRGGRAPLALRAIWRLPTLSGCDCNENLVFYRGWWRWRWWAFWWAWYGIVRISNKIFAMHSQSQNQAPRGALERMKFWSAGCLERSIVNPPFTALLCQTRDRWKGFTYILKEPPSQRSPYPSLTRKCIFSGVRVCTVHNYAYAAAGFNAARLGWAIGLESWIH